MVGRLSDQCVHFGQRQRTFEADFFKCNCGTIRLHQCHLKREWVTRNSVPDEEVVDLLFDWFEEFQGRSCSQCREEKFDEGEGT